MDFMQDRLMQQFQNMDKAYEAYARSKGMTYLSLVVLEEIYELGDGCTQKQISEDTHYPKQSINLTVKAFLKDGLIQLKELPENRKNKEITLTDKGRLCCMECVVPLLQQEERAMADLGEVESRELLRLLDRYGTAYCDQLARITKSV